MLISLIVCTYNRSDILKETVPKIQGLVIPEEVSLELIIVDNNSNDDTQVVVTEMVSTLNKSVMSIDARYVFEAQQGLSYARNTGYSVSKGKYVAYIDDECILPKQWLAEAFKIISNEKPAFLGGPYYGKYLTGSSSVWFKESFGDSYILQLDLKDGPMQERCLSGGNMFVRRDVFEKVGLFDVDLGMTGEILNYGEELEFQRRFLKSYPNEVIWYDSKIFVWHLIRDMKMKISFLLKDAFTRGRSIAELRNQRRRRLIWSPFLLVFFIAKAIFSALIKLLSSIVKQEHYFILLYNDYKNSTWRDIGGAWYKTKKLLGFIN